MKRINGRNVRHCWECEYCKAHPFKDNQHICTEESHTKPKDIPDAQNIADFCPYRDVERTGDEQHGT